MANLTKNEKYIVDMYVRYFGKAPSVAEIAKYNEFGKPKLILNEIIGDADDSKAGLTTKEFVNNAFQNLFGRDATTKEMNKYSKVVDAGKDLPINAIVKSAKKADKGVYEAKKAIAIMLAEKENTTNYNLDKITKDTYADVYNLKTKKLLVDSVAQLETKIDAMPDNVSGTTFTLTAGSDVKTGTEKGDVFNAYEEFTASGVKATLTGVDSLDGGAGKDVLNVKTDGAITVVNATISNIETINLESGAGVAFNTTTYTSVETLNATKGTSATLTAAATTDVNVSGITTGDIVVNGGKNVVVNDATAGNDITIGATTVNAGTITVTDTNVGAGAIKVDGGTDVTVTATASNGTAPADTIEVGRGGAATDLASGKVVVTSNAASKAGTDETLANIKVSGGSSITINQVATSTVAATDKAGATVTMGAVEVDAGTATTTVSVSQTAAVAEVVAKDAVAEKAATQVVTFKALATGESITLITDAVTDKSLTFVASKDLTAAEVASAFANLAKNATEGSASTTLGYYTNGISGGLTGDFTTGAVTSIDANNASVTFSTLTDTDGATAGIQGLTITTAGTAGKVNVAAQVAGTAAVKAVTGVQGVTVNTVLIDDNTTAAVIETITVDGYAAASKIGNTTATTKLSSLTLANAGAVDMVVADTADTLALSLNKMGTSTDTAEAVVTFTLAPKTLNITNTGDNYVDLTANATETLSVAGSGTLNIADVDLQGLKTLTVSGDASLVLSGQESNTLTSVTTTTTGTVTSTIDASAATYTGGAGVDNVTLSSTTVSKAINLGAGNDTLTLASGTTSLTTEIVAGDGTDTLVMTNADAATASASSTFETKISGFEKLSIDAVTAGKTIDLANMDDISYVISKNATGGSNVTETSVITFQNLEVGQSVTVAGLTLTNTTTAQITAANVAGGFASLTAGATAGNTIANATWTGTLAAWNTGTVSAANVTFTSTTASSNVTDIIQSVGNATASTGVLAGVQGAEGDGSGTYEVVTTTVTDGLTLGQSFTYLGIKITAKANMTAAEVAAAFKAIAADGGTSTVTYTASGSLTTPASWTTGTAVITVSGVVLTATSSNFDNHNSDLSQFAVTANAPSTATTLGVNTSNGAAALTLANMANNGTLELTDAGNGVTVTMADASGSTDTFNIVTKVDASDLIFGTVTVSGVETINITADDITPVNTTTGLATISKATMTLSDAAVKTIVITGDSDLDLTAVGASLKTVDAQAMTGALTFSSAVNDAVITGGSGNDILTATGSNQKLIGGAGDDILTGGTLSTLTGGAGNDTFVIAAGLSNVNSYATITDLSAGDVIDTASSVFVSAKVTLANTAVFQDYANEAIKTSSNTDVRWFQFDNNTYVIQNDSASTSFVNGTDGIIKISGLVDLSTATFNATNGEITIA